MSGDLGYHLQHPGFALLLPPLWFSAFWLARRRVSLPFAGGTAWTGAAPPLPASARLRWRWLPAAAEALALVLFTAALMQPVERLPAPPRPPGRDLLLCLDRSSSMAAEDLAPGRTRLAVGLDLAASFVLAREHDRIGFVTFARFADLRCPPTLDHAAVATLLQRTTMVPKDGPEDATAIGAAVALAAQTLRRSAAPGRVVVLVTDGEENVAVAGAPRAIAPLHAAQLCAASGIRVHGIVVGRGNQRADGSFRALDTTAVEQLATTTGGRFFTVGDAAALAAVYAAIDELEAVPLVQDGVVERECYPLLVALGLLSCAARALLLASWQRRLV